MKKMSYGLFTFMVFGLLVSCVSAPKAPPLSQAIMSNNASKVESLLAQDIDINETYYGKTPLERAAMQGNLEIVKLLMNKGAQNVEKAFGEAVSRKNIEVAQYIAENGGFNINDLATSFYPIFNDKNISIVDRIATVKLISNNKLNSSLVLAYVEPIYYQQVIDALEIDINSRSGLLSDSLLHVATKRNNLDLVLYLLENKFNINTLNANNQTALVYAITVYGADIDWNAPVIENEETAKIKFISDMPYYSNPQEIQRKQVGIVNALINAGIDLNNQDKYGWTVLHYAAAAYPQGLLDLLVSNGGDVEIKTNLGKNVMQVKALRK